MFVPSLAPIDINSFGRLLPVSLSALSLSSSRECSIFQAVFLPNLFQKFQLCLCECKCRCTPCYRFKTPSLLICSVNGILSPSPASTVESYLWRFESSGNCLAFAKDSINNSSLHLSEVNIILLHTLYDRLSC